ncbi:MAG: hypothetical protein J3R72DRAFT_426304 [Linnemannia gamsii]|nr:MAG: hypothetical protein J3R72DRAFT_426304 [Linnemannia gamsii]
MTQQNKKHTTPPSLNTPHPQQGALPSADIIFSLQQAATIDSLMKLFKLDFNIKDRYRRGLADGARSNRSPQSEATATLSSYHDPHHHASSPSSPSALVSANTSSSRSGRDEHMEQWNHFGSSSLEAAHSKTYAHPHARGGGGSIGRLHSGQDYGYDDRHEDDASNDGYMSSSSSSSGGSFSSSSALSPSSSHSSDDDDYDDDDDMQGGAGGGDYGGSEDSQDNEYSNSTHPFTISSSNNADYHDYYQGSHGSGEHGGLLPAAASPAIVPQSDREALEQEAKQRRLERHADKRRQSLNGNQPAPDYAQDDDDEDEDEDEDDEDDDDDDEDEDQEEDYEEDYENDENKNMEYYEDAYDTSNSEEYDPIADYNYGYESDNNNDDRICLPAEEEMASGESGEVSGESDGSDGSESEDEQDETFYDGEEDADEEDYHQHTSPSLSSPSIYDDDASVYRDYHQYHDQEQVSEEFGNHQDPLRQLPPPQPEPSMPPVVYNHSSVDHTTDMEDDNYFLDAVPEMKLSFGLDYSDDSNHVFGYPTNHNIGNNGLHRQASQMASYDAGEGASMNGYHISPSTHNRLDSDHCSEPQETFVSVNHIYQQQYQQTQQHVDYNHNIPEHSPEINNTSQPHDQTIDFQHYHHSSNPTDQRTQTQQEVDITTSTASTSNNTRPRSSFLALPGPISNYWKRLKRGPSSTPSSSRPPYPP